MVREGEIRIPSGCAISGMINRSGKRMSGEAIIRSISVMHDRSNGLGGGFAAYGIYPEYRDYYALHIFYNTVSAKRECEEFLEGHFDIINLSKIPTRKMKEITDEPLIWRYFVTPLHTKLSDSQLNEREFVARCVFRINTQVKDAYVFSSGSKMGGFTAVGYPADIGRFYRLEDYEGYCFTAHGRYPTNTPGWWGGAHPFALLDYSVVHNGEISSYDANRRAMEMHGYKCTLMTDTEVITYIIDYLHRKKDMSFPEIASIIAAPFWETIEKMPQEERETCEYLRNVFASQLITGPFSILVGFEGGIMALNDRLKLRSMVVGERGDTVYFASEEAAIRVIEPNLDSIRSPGGGEPVIVYLNGGEA
jgi:glutamate synthase domain-containing protein 1